MTLYFLSIARIPLATAASAYFVGPIMAVVLFVVVLEERMTSRKAPSLALGFVGSIRMRWPARPKAEFGIIGIGPTFLSCDATRHHAVPA